MKLSVLMITYNHERFISEAIDSVLMQKTNFDFEIIIGEDCSTDKTRGIVFEYARKYPSKIKVITSEKNVGAQENVIRTFNAACGEYLALLEGDDYWTDPYKLQKQVDFLDKHKDYSICFHQVYFRKESSNTLYPVDRELPDRNSFTIEDIAAGNFLDSPSVVYRNCFDKNLPSWFRESPVGDYVLHMLHAKHGKIGYLPDIMAVYRLHKGGIWSLQTYDYRLSNFSKTVDLLINEFDGNVKEILIKQNAANYNSLAKIAYGERDVEKAKRYLENAFFLDDSLKEEWLNYYPTLMSRLYNSRRYKAAERIFNFINRVLFVGQRKKK